MIEKDIEKTQGGRSLAAAPGSPCFVTRVTQLTIAPKGEPIFSERAMQIEVADEAAGEFIRITQQGDDAHRCHSIEIDPDEWQTLKEAVDRLLTSIAEANDERSNRGSANE